MLWREKKGERYVWYKGSEMGNAAVGGAVRLCVGRNEEMYVKLKKKIETKTRIKSQSRYYKVFFGDHAITEHSAFLSSHCCQIHKALMLPSIIAQSFNR
jgi:enterochelin esterase-like enzyme